MINETIFSDTNSCKGWGGTGREHFFRAYAVSEPRALAGLLDR